MTYKFLDDRQYLMPTHFGPMTGPRHGPSGNEFPQPDRRGMEIYQLSFRTEAAVLQELLPPKFEIVGEPTVTISAQYMNNIGWLAGLGYNTLGVSAAVRFVGERDSVEGNLLLVLWENLTEPILTGREQLGFSKIYCDLPAPRAVNGSDVISAGWHGHKFFELVFSDAVSLEPVSSDVAADQPPCILNLRYVPDVDLSTKGRIIEVTCTTLPFANPTTVEVRQKGTAAFKFFHTAWSDMPTQYRIVEGLRRIPMLEVRSATYVRGIGSRDAHNFRVIR
jgi:acetoacetate decarboxylase